IGLRVLLVEDVDAGDVIGLAHRAVDRDGQGHRVAVLDDRRQFELYPAAIDRRRADESTDRRFHRSRCSGGGRRKLRKAETGRRQRRIAGLTTCPVSTAATTLCTRTWPLSPTEASTTSAHKLP